MPKTEWGAEYRLVERPRFIGAGLRGSQDNPRQWFALDDQGREWYLDHLTGNWSTEASTSKQEFRDFSKTD